MMNVLGIEASCDETGVAIYNTRKGLLSHALHSQIQLHQAYGGVVPELASRDHVQRLIPLTQQVLSEAQLSKHDLDAVAYTAGPGLIGALLVGASFAKTLAFGLGIPAIAVHHLEAHILAAQLASPELSFPFVALLVSGGHTQLIEAQSLGRYVCLGETLDDAVGEAFDKTAKCMGLGYPGGPIIAALAEQKTEGLSTLTPFPRPMIHRPELDLSFSGLKTHALQAWLKSDQNESARIEIAHAFQSAVVDVLVSKCMSALLSTGCRRLVVAGGVGANQSLRAALNTQASINNIDVFFPSIAFCTDNGAMIAYAGALHYVSGQQDHSLAIRVKPRIPLSTISLSEALYPPTDV